MPNNILKAHEEIDIEVEKCYSSKPFNSDEERLEHLFKFYESMLREKKLL